MVRFSILVNGTPSDFFKSSRSLRQGDSLSPLLFVMVMEPLSWMLNATMTQGLLTGFSVGSRDNEEFVVNHLLFADRHILTIIKYGNLNIIVHCEISMLHFLLTLPTDKLSIYKFLAI
jgi:hypothetical protein